MTDFLVIVRHTQTPDNAGLIFSGHRPVGLTALGMQQARTVTDRIKRLQGVCGIVSSDLRRARVLADMIGHAMDIVPQFDARLREINLGTMTGMSSKRLKRRFQRPEYAIFSNRNFDLRPLGGESAAQVLVRLESALAEAATRHFAGRSRADRRLVVVGHSTAFEMLLRDRYGVIEHLHEQGRYDTVRWPLRRR